MIEAPYPIVLILSLIALVIVLRKMERDREAKMRKLIREELAAMFRTDDGEDYGHNVIELNGTLSIDRSPMPYWRNRTNVESSA
jgi:hypothetical protein